MGGDGPIRCQGCQRTGRLLAIAAEYGHTLPLGWRQRRNGQVLCPSCWRDHIAAVEQRKARYRATGAIGDPLQLNPYLRSGRAGSKPPGPAAGGGRNPVEGDP